MSRVPRRAPRRRSGTLATASMWPWDGPRRVYIFCRSTRPVYGVPRNARVTSSPRTVICGLRLAVPRDRVRDSVVGGDGREGVDRFGDGAAGLFESLLVLVRGNAFVAVGVARSV